MNTRPSTKFGLLLETDFVPTSGGISRQGMSTWTSNTYQCRFKIPNILEYYAATEGNATTYNTMNRVGSIGYIPLLARDNYPLKIAKYDQATESYVRGPDGYLVEAAFGEPGLS